MESNNFNKLINDMLNNNKDIEEIKKELNKALNELDAKKDKKNQKKKELDNYLNSISVEVRNAVITSFYNSNIAAKVMALSEADKKRFNTKEEVVAFINNIEKGLDFSANIYEVKDKDVLDYIDKEVKKNFGKKSFNKEFDNIIKMILDI